MLRAWCIVLAPQAVVFNVKSSASQPQPPLPRKADVRVYDSARTQTATYRYGQQ